MSAVHSVFTVWEVRVAHRLGLSRDATRALRQAWLVEGTDWGIVGKKAMLSEGAISILAEKMRLPLPDGFAPEKAQGEATAAVPAAKKRLLLPAPFRGELIAWNSPVNERILQAYLPGTDPKNARALVRVQVKSNKNFTRGMRFKAVNVQGDLFRLEGNCPRWRGKF